MIAFRRLIGAALLPGALIPAMAAEDAVPVAVSRAQTAAVIEQVPVTGTVTSPHYARISAAVGGLVKSVHVDAGDRVETGDLLIELDAELDEQTLLSARAAMRRAEHELADARRRLEEARTLRHGAVSASEVRSLETEVEIDAAELDRLRAEADRQAAVLQRHSIRAPFNGVVNRRLTAIGEWVTPGTAVLELVAIENLRLDFRVPQEYFPRLNKDTEVEVTLDALPDQRLAGRIGAAVPVNDPSARTFLLRVLLNDDVGLMPGMSAHAELKIDTGRRSVTVPRDALLRYPDGRVTVWTVDDSGDTPTVSEQQVTIGLLFDEQAEIRDGLDAGTTVVVEGNEALQENQPVRIHSRNTVSR